MPVASTLLRQPNYRRDLPIRPTRRRLVTTAHVADLGALGAVRGDDALAMPHSPNVLEQFAFKSVQRIERKLQ